MKQILCSHCRKDTSDFYVKLNLHTSVIRKKSDDSEEKIANTDISNIEYLCKDCFDKFAETFENF